MVAVETIEQHNYVPAKYGYVYCEKFELPVHSHRCLKIQVTMRNSHQGHDFAPSQAANYNSVIRYSLLSNNIFHYL
jgi:hypothetical protein